MAHSTTPIAATAAPAHARARLVLTILLTFGLLSTALGTSRVAAAQAGGPLAGPVFAHWEELPGFAALTSPDGRNRAIQTRAFRTLLERYNTVLWELDLTAQQEADFRARVRQFQDESAGFVKEHGREMRALQQTISKDPADREDGELRDADLRLVELDKMRPHPEHLVASIWEDLSETQQHDLRRLYDQRASEQGNDAGMRPAMDSQTAGRRVAAVEVDESTLTEREQRGLERLRQRAQYLNRIAAEDGAQPAPDVSTITFDFERADSESASTTGG
ncbi:MAG: hypothetical protein D8M59_12750 [Planctomycetes bacterium]|nr:hypothetical protein [Planctomycetota bacterium]NOG53687.1 hypothetical protein [Planctomycetota bacterium]